MPNSAGDIPRSPDGSLGPQQPRSALIERRDTLPSTQVFHEPPRPDAGGDSINLRDYWQIILKRKWTVMTFFLIIVVSVVTATFLMTKIYRASMTLQIDQQDANVTKIQEVTPTETVSASKDFYQTQYEILRSRTMARRVIDQLNLGDHPLYTRKETKSWLDFFSRKDTPVTDAKASSSTDRESGLVSGFLRQLTVEPIRNSRLVKIHFDSPDPRLAAQVANAISGNFINLNLERRMDASSYAKTFLQERLEQIRVKLEESEKALNEYTNKQGIVKVGENQTNPDSQALQEFTAALAKAQGERIRAEALYNQVRAADTSALSAVLDNKLVQDFKQRKAKLETDYQENLKIYQRGYPKMIQLESQIAETQAKIDEEITQVRGAVKGNYDAAVQQEELLAAKLKEAKQVVLGTQNLSFKFNLLKRDVDTNRSLYDGLLQRFKEVGVAGGVGVNNISVVDKAEVPFFPFKPNVMTNALLAAFVGLFGGIGLAFLFENLDDTIKQPDELEKLLGLPVLGIVPMVKGTRSGDTDLALIQSADSRSAFAESYRSMRTALQFSTADGAPRVLMITSSSVAEGKSTTALGLAIQFAQAGKTVLLIDADLRKASLHKSLGLDNSRGLTNHLAGDATPEQISRPCQIPRLFVICSGPLPPNPAELLGSTKMVSLLSLAAEKFDQVIIDGPPILGLADAPLLGSLAQATILVVEAGGTSRGFARTAVKRLRATRTRLLGGLLTKLKPHGGTYGYYHSYYYHQYGGSDQPAPQQLTG